MGHVVTGNLDIIDKLGNFDHLCTWGRIKRDVMVTVESLKNEIIDKNNCNFNYLNDWEQILKLTVVSITGLDLCKILIDVNFLDKQIDIAHTHFVMTTVDKASNNFAFICKKFYIGKIKVELGVRGGRIEGNDVHAYCMGSSPQEIVCTVYTA